MVVSKLTGLEFSTTELGTSYNIIRSVVDDSTRRARRICTRRGMVFRTPSLHDLMSDGRIGLGTTQPASNIHVYDTTPGDMNTYENFKVLVYNKQTRDFYIQMKMKVVFLKGFSNTVNATTGLALGVANNSTGVINNLNLIHTSNVGVGIPYTCFVSFTFLTVETCSR